MSPLLFKKVISESPKLSIFPNYKFSSILKNFEKCVNRRKEILFGTSKLEVKK